MARVLYLLVRDGNREIYGGEWSTMTTAELARDGGHDVRFVVSDEDDLAVELRRRGLPVTVIAAGNPLDGRRPLPERARRMLRLVRGLSAAIGSGGIDIVHASGVPATLAAVAAARRRARVVFHLRDLSRHGRTRWHELVAAAGADALIAISDSLRERLVATAPPPLRDWFGRRLRVIYNGFPLDALRGTEDRATARAALGLGDEVVCLLVGGLDARKRQLDVITRVLPRVPGMRLVLIGGAKDAAYARACQEAADEAVTFTGYLAPAEVRRWYAAADLALVASAREGLSRFALEAQVAGLPVVTTRIPGPIDVVVDGVTGVHVDGDDDMARVLAELVRDQGKRAQLAAGARAFDWKRFSLASHRQAVLALYRELSR